MTSQRTESTEPEAPPLDLVAIGSPLVDIVATVGEGAIEELGLAHGSMTLVDLERSEIIRAGLGDVTESSGGSAANTACGVAALGGNAGFIGCIADDVLGEVFTREIRAAGVEYEPVLAEAGSSSRTSESSPGTPLGTGRCLVLVGEDAERTMITHLGAAVAIRPGNVSSELLVRGEIIYLEGYLWDLPAAKEAMRVAMDVAHQHDRSVAFSLSDTFCVERHQREFLDLLRDDVDVLFGNEAEMRSLFGAPHLDGVLDAAEETGVLVAVTLGPQGSVVMTARGPVTVPAVAVRNVVDTNGAGDLYAAGFLYGLTHGAEPEECARLGALCASEVIAHFGARPVQDLRAMAQVSGLLPLGH